ncbi:DUF3160 domain-containing protein [Moorena producens]|uniref:DUF3160 domain-containing protein n=1 Tax=Moorena producens TaxID=1155739 RepID=UPI003C76B641
MSDHTFLEDGIDSSKVLVNPASAEVSTDVFSYNPAFDQELEKIGQISPQEFAKRYDAKVDYLTQISWDPTQAQFWDLFNSSPIKAQFWDWFNSSPKKHNQKTNRGNYSHYNFCLNSDELAVFKKQGFVVSERMGAHSFAELFYRIYSNDLPVFVSADALLHAWHRSYDAILEELEESYLATSLDEILTGMADKIPEASNQYGDGVLDLSLIDADYFLGVARSLLAGEAVKTKLNQDARVAATFQAIEAEQIQEFELFGRDRHMDFSQFKVRGHYENSETLKKYFRAVMWCGRVDLRIAGKPQEASPRELGAAIILNDLLTKSGKFEQWQQFDQMLQTFVGPTDSMTFAQLADLLKQAKIKSPTDIKDLSTLEQLQTKISANNLGFQNIRSHVYVSPEEDQIQAIIPHSFTVIGQKFILDSWMLSKVVYDDIVWNGEKVQRRVPSGLDVAFATLGNTQVVPELVDRITNQNGRKFRDGLNYQHNLAAAFNVVDQLNPSAWEENLYMNWLATLRELSKPTTDSKYPEAMRTRAWGMKTLNTQLASWTQLRHDTILYAKQSYTLGLACIYPAGFVEPRPEFWQRFEKMAVLAGQLIENTPFPERIRGIQQKQTKFFKNFSQQLTILKEIALKELAQQELTEAQTNFLEKVVEIQRFASGGPTYTGWYPRLFYKEPEDSDKWDAIVADVHTNVPDPMVGDPGSVLHQGVGNIDLLMIAVDNGKDKMVFAGPVLSHYQFEMPEVSRKSDSEWKKDIKTGKLPPRPNWTKSYLVVDEFLNEFSPPGE